MKSIDVLTNNTRLGWRYLALTGRLAFVLNYRCEELYSTSHLEAVEVQVNTDIKTTSKVLDSSLGYNRLCLKFWKK